VIFHLLIFFIYIPNHTQVAAELPFGLEEGDYARYTQEFSTGETHLLQWTITKINSSSAEIHVYSYGIRFNFTSMSFIVVPGGGILTISLGDWSIQRFTYLNETEMPEQYIGFKVPFWIPTPITATTRVNTLYDLNVTPTLVGPLDFNCLPNPRICWMTENHYSSNEWMQRYYDSTTGFVLQIFSFVQVLDHHILITETLNETNITILQQPVPSQLPLLEIGILTSVIVGIIFIFGKYRRRSVKTSE
jgi:hypothetical protein